MDYYKILNEGESNRKCYEVDGKIVLVTEKDAPSKSNSHKVRKNFIENNIKSKKVLGSRSRYIFF